MSKSIFSSPKIGTEKVWTRLSLKSRFNELDTGILLRLFSLSLSETECMFRGVSLVME